MASTPSRSTSRRRPRSAADREAAAEARRDKLTALHEQLAAGVQELASSRAWADMLTAAARFHRYSLRNCLLIGMQRPDATRVAGFTTWKELGRTVRKGEKGIQILAPCTYRVTEDQDDPGPAGEPAPAEPTETVEGAERRQLRGFRVAHVFDIAQTDGDPLPDVRPELLPGQAPDGLWDRLVEHVHERGYTVERIDCGTANGYADRLEHVVAVRPDLDPAQAVKTLVHELAHIVLGHLSPDDLYKQRRDVAEVEAESVAAIVCMAAGMDTSRYTTPYLAGWSNGDAKKIAESGTRVLAAAAPLIDRHVENGEAVQEQVETLAG